MTLRSRIEQMLSARGVNPRLAAVAGGVVLLVLVGIAFGLTRGGTPEVTVQAVASATATSNAGVPAAATATPTSSETPIPGAVVTTVKDLIAKFGYPPGTNYAELRIPTIGVDAMVGSRAVGRDGVMAAPAGPADVVWYDMGQWAGLGGAPGGGNAIFSGHVDYAANVPYANVRYRGQGVFSQLHLLSQGDIVEVLYKGQTLRYEVVSRQQLGPNADWASVWKSNGKDSVTLYTCGGAFDASTAEYADRVVVRAERV